MTEFPESPFSRLDFESDTDQSWTSSPIPIPIQTWFEHRDRFWVLSREPRLFEPETPILHIKPVEISPNSKSETRDKLTSSPSPSLRLGDPGTSRPSPSPRRVWRPHSHSDFRVRNERLGKFWKFRASYLDLGTVPSMLQFDPYDAYVYAPRRWCETWHFRTSNYSCGSRRIDVLDIANQYLGYARTPQSFNNSTMIYTIECLRLLYEHQADVLCTAPASIAFISDMLLDDRL